MTVSLLAPYLLHCINRVCQWKVNKVSFIITVSQSVSIVCLIRLNKLFARYALCLSSLIHSSLLSVMLHFISFHELVIHLISNFQCSLLVLWTLFQQSFFLFYTLTLYIFCDIGVVLNNLSLNFSFFCQFFQHHISGGKSTIVTYFSRYVPTKILLFFYASLGFFRK